MELEGIPKWLSGKESACQSRRCRRCTFDPWVRKISWSRNWQPTPICLLGKSHGQRSLVGYSSRGCNELDMSEDARTHTYGARMLHSWVLRREMGAQHPDGGFLYKLLFSRGVLISSRGILILCGLKNLCKTSHFKFVNGYFEAEYHMMTWLLGTQQNESWRIIGVVEDQGLVRQGKLRSVARVTSG